MNRERFDEFTGQYDQTDGRSDFKQTPLDMGRFIYALIRLERPEVLVEVGAMNGATSAWMLRALRENGRGQYQGWEKNENEARLWGRNMLHIFGDSPPPSVLNRASFYDVESVPCDFAFIDHEPKAEYLRAFDMLDMEEGGILLAHDLAYTGMERNKKNAGVWDLYDRLLEDRKWDVLPLYGGRGLVMARKVEA